MATTDQLVDRAKVILSRTNDSSLNAKVITQLQAAQERLEDEAWLPDFLYARQSVATINTHQYDLDVTLTRFIRLHDRAGGIRWQNLVNPPTPDETYVKLKRYDELEQLLQLFPGDLSVGGGLGGYFLVDRLLVLRPKPTVTAVIPNLEFNFYQAEATLPTAGNSTLWTQRAADYLLGEAGLILAQTLRDKDALGLFQGLRAAGKARLIKRSQGDEQADQEYIMGDRD